MKSLAQQAQPLYLSLANSIESRILEGVYPLHSRLPAERELAKEFSVAVMTARQGFGLLVQKGFLQRDRIKGTIVVRNEVAAANVAVIFGDSVTAESAHYYRGILSRLNDGAMARRWNLRYYDELNRDAFPEECVRKNEELLLKDHRSDPFNGLIVSSPGEESIIPQEMVGLIPVAIAESASPDTDVCPDYEHFGSEAIRVLHESGCRRMFFFCSHWITQKPPESIFAVIQEAQNRSLVMPGIHCQKLHSQGYAMEKEIFENFQALMRQWAERGEAFPDGLIFNDDITLRSVIPAILQSGVVIPRDSRIFCLGSEDHRFHYGVPVMRYELSQAKVASHLLGALERRLQKQEAPPTLTLRGSLFLE